MCIVGAAVTSATSSLRRRTLIEAWRPEATAGLRRCADAIRREGAAAVLQIVHLGRETLGAESYYASVAPTSVRSPRESTAPRSLSEGEIDDLVDGFRLSAANAALAGFDGIELHAAHGYLLAQFLSGVTNGRPGAESFESRMAPVLRIASAVRGAAQEAAIGIRISAGDPNELGLTIEQISDLFSHLNSTVDYANLTVGVRGDYVRDMATARPPLLHEVSRLRATTNKPLLISHGFRSPATMVDAIRAGADMIGMARALIADPDLPEKVIQGRAGAVRPCVACNEDCRALDPALLCSVNPDLAAPGDPRRRAAPVWRGVSRRSHARVAIVGAGVAGLETALTLQNAGSSEVVMFEAENQIGGSIGLVAKAPNRAGWNRMLEFYRTNLDPSRIELRVDVTVVPEAVADFDAVVVAVGAEETIPSTAAGTRARTVSAAIAAGPKSLANVAHLVVVDDGFSWWPSVNALELGIAAGVREITLITPDTAFATGIPPDSRAQLLGRIRGNVRLGMKPMTSLVAVTDDSVHVSSAASGMDERISAEAVIVVGERRARAWSGFESVGPAIAVIGDAVVPRRVPHAIAEGRAAATTILAGQVDADRSTAEGSRWMQATS
jgi:2,4-dienoyl-CoA reductase (NADPH2)